MPLTEGVVDLMGNQMARSLSTAEGPIKIMDKSVVEIDGVEAGRVLLGEPSVTGMRALAFFVPGNDCMGVLVYTTTATSMRELGNSLDASAMRTRGAVPPSNPGILFTMLTNPAFAAKVLFGLLLVVGSVAFAVLILRRGRRAPPRRRVPQRPYRPK